MHLKFKFVSNTFWTAIVIHSDESQFSFNTDFPKEGYSTNYYKTLLVKRSQEYKFFFAMAVRKK